MKLLKQITLVFLIPMFIVSCGSDKEGKVSEYDELKFTAEEFLDNLFNKNFKRAELFCDNSSKGSVRKLSSFEFDFRNVYFRGVDTCVITKNTAECICSYENYDADLFEQTLVMKKYNGEWLAHFVLDENFDNIFLYDYSNKVFKGEGKWNHLDLDTATYSFVKDVLAVINSNKLVIDYTSSGDLKLIDEDLDNVDDYYAESKVTIDGFQFKRKYSMEYGKLESYVLDIQNFTENDMQFYYKALVAMCLEEFGTPFNIKEEENKYGYHNFHSLRWFVKGCNELVELNFSPGVFIITLKKVV